MSEKHHHHHSCNDHDHHDHGIAAKTNGLKWAFSLNLIFAFLELGGGLWTNSMAITADALHDFGDALAIGMALLLEYYGNRKADQEYTYGYRRYSLLGALINGVILTAGSLFILKISIERLQSPPEVRAPEMIAFAILGLAVNGFSAWKLSKTGGTNQRMAMLHLLEDVMGWLIIFVGAILMTIHPMPIIDPILSIVLSLFVLWNVFKIGRKLLRIFMQAMPEEIEMSKLRTQVSALSGVKEMHAIQGWSLDGEEHTLSVHLSVDSKVNFTQLMDLKCKVKDIFAQFHIRYSTIEFESDTDCCLEHDHEPAIKTKGHHHHHHH